MIPGLSERDARARACDRRETDRSRRFVQAYLAPLLERLDPAARPLRVLSSGCGVGADVDALLDAGHDAVGIDPGIRRAAWMDRANRRRLLAADGTALPFRDGWFDAVVSFGVLDHVGADDDTFAVSADADALRGRYVREALRVVRPGGSVIIGAIHRLCPLDFFHASTPQGIRWHGPWDRHSISWGQIARWCRGSGVPVRLESLPLTRDTFAWDGMRARLGERRLDPLLRAVDACLGRPATAWLRRTPLNPFLLMRVTRLPA